MFYKRQVSSQEVAFVAGATGYTGREVVRVCRERGIRTVAHVRPDSSRLDEWRAQFQALGAEVDTTAWQEDEIAQTLGRVQPDFVFGLLGTTRARASRDAKQGADSSYEAVDYGLTALLIRCASGLERPGGRKVRFVYLSAANAADKGPSNYTTARWKVEQDLKQGTLPYVIARPSFITGADRDGRPGERVGASVADGALALAGVFGARRLRDRFRSISGATLAEALVRLARDPDAEGGTFYSDQLR